VSEALRFSLPKADKLTQNKTLWESRIRNREVKTAGARWFVNVTIMALIMQVFSIQRKLNNIASNH